LLFTASALSGYAATATVRGGDGEGFCTVTWDEGPGRSGTGEVGCSDQPAGTSLSIRVFMWPDENDPWDVPSAVFAALMVSVPLTVVGVWRLLYVRSRRPAVLPVTSPAHLTVPAALDDESWQRADEPLAAFLARLAPYARQQVPADGWEHPARPDGATRVVTLRRLGAALAGPAVLLTCVLSATAAPTYRWGVLGNGATGTTVATSTGETPVEGWGPFPREITVRFVDADGVEHLAEVVSDRDRPAGDEVAVEYSVGHPGQARLVDAGVLDGSVLLAASGLGIALLWLVWNGVRLMRRFHAVRSAEEAPGRPALGLLTADMLGKPLVLACDPPGLTGPLRRRSAARPAATRHGGGVRHRRRHVGHRLRRPTRRPDRRRQAPGRSDAAAQRSGLPPRRGAGGRPAGQRERPRPRGRGSRADADPRLMMPRIPAHPRAHPSDDAAPVVDR
jgi:hypothetical protein